MLHEFLEAQPPLVLRHGLQESAFHPADALEPVGVKVVIKARQLQGGTVHVILCNLYFLKIFGGVNDFKAEFLYQAAKLHAKFL